MGGSKRQRGEGHSHVMLQPVRPPDCTSDDGVLPQVGAGVRWELWCIYDGRWELGRPEGRLWPPKRFHMDGIPRQSALSKAIDFARSSSALRIDPDFGGQSPMWVSNGSTTQAQPQV